MASATIPRPIPPWRMNQPVGSVAALKEALASTWTHSASSSKWCGACGKCMSERSTNWRWWGYDDRNCMSTQESTENDVAHLKNAWVIAAHNCFVFWSAHSRSVIMSGPDPCAWPKWKLVKTWVIAAHTCFMFWSARSRSVIVSGPDPCAWPIWMLVKIRDASC